MRSSKNCDLQFANNDIFKANYSIDIGEVGDSARKLQEGVHNRCAY